jgi:hypothetical protein
LGIAAKRTRQLAQYTPPAPRGRSHRPPHRSQYFSSTWISGPSVLPMKFMIASLHENEEHSNQEKALAPVYRPRARSSYDDLCCYLINNEAVIAA